VTGGAYGRLSPIPSTNAADLLPGWRHCARQASALGLLLAFSGVLATGAAGGPGFCGHPSYGRFGPSTAAIFPTCRAGWRQPDSSRLTSREPLAVGRCWGSDTAAILGSGQAAVMAHRQSHWAPAAAGHSNLQSCPRSPFGGKSGGGQSRSLQLKCRSQSGNRHISAE